MIEAQRMKQFHYEHITIRDTMVPYVFHRNCIINKNHKFLAHWHESIELVHIFEGECEIMIDTECHQARVGDIICVNSEQIHCLNTATSAKYDALIIPPSYLQKCSLPTDVLLQTKLLDEKAIILYDIIKCEAHERKVFYKTAQNAALNTLLVYLFRNFSEERNGAVQHTKVRHDLIRRCIDFIHHNYLSDISTSDISAELGITVNYLCSYFKKSTGTTIKKYINELRCYDAEAMLYSGQYTVMEVGANCGFDNMAYFAKTYRSIIGVNPSVTLAKGLEENKGTGNRRRNKKTPKKRTDDYDSIAEEYEAYL